MSSPAGNLYRTVHSSILECLSCRLVALWWVASILALSSPAISQTRPNTETFGTPQVMPLPAISPQYTGIRADGTHAINAQAIGFGGITPAPSTASVEYGNVYDYTFTRAPADWWVQSGKWGMTKWRILTPGWTKYGGWSHEIAALWNKRRFSGDFSYQVYFAFKQGLSFPRWSQNYYNMGIGFCGDGQNLSSGYSLLIGADNNSRTILLRKGEPIAETSAPEALFPSLVDGVPEYPSAPVPKDLSATFPKKLRLDLRPSQSEIDARKIMEYRYLLLSTAPTAWHARIDKTGNRIECWLDNNLIFTYDDPQSIDSGQFAVWTYENGIVLPRVQIYYENEIKPAPKSRSANSFAAAESPEAIKAKPRGQ